MILELLLGLVTVTAVIDGDTVTLSSVDGPMTVDLAEIDAPELDQPYGEQARDTLASLVLDREVQVRSWANGHRARLEVEGVDISRHLLACGLAWSDDSRDEELVLATMVARSQALGLWQQERPIPPTVWRDRPAPARRAGPTPGPTTLAALGRQIQLAADGDRIVIGNEIRTTAPAAGPAASSSVVAGDPCAELFGFVDGFGSGMAESMAGAFATDGGTVTSSLPDRTEFLTRCRALPADVQACLSLQRMMAGDTDCEQKLQQLDATTRATFEAMGMSMTDS